MYTYLQKNSDAKAKNTHKYYLEFCEQKVKRGLQKILVLYIMTFMLTI